MTGEIVAGAAAAKAAGKAAKAIGAENKLVSQELLEAAKDTPGMERAAELYGRRQALKQAIIFQAYKPLAKVTGLASEYFGREFASDLGAKLKDVPDEKIQSPKASIAAPAMQALGYSLDEPALKDLYLELLAKASNSDFSDDAHPAFSDVIRQLTSDEALLLKRLLQESPTTPIVELKTVLPGGGYNTVAPHVLDVPELSGSFNDAARIASYVDNWVRLGLVTVSYTSHLSRPRAYDWVEKHPMYSNVLELIERVNDTKKESDETQAISVGRGFLEATSFGDKFAAVVGMNLP